MLIGMLKEHFFNLCINDVAVFDRIKLLCLKKYFTLCQGLVSSKLAKIEAVFCRCSSKEMFLKISQISQENTSVCVSSATLLKIGVFL